VCLAPAANSNCPQLLPAVNSDIAAAAAAEDAGSPGEDSEAAGRKRLEERLKLYCLMERQVKGDGNCQVRPAWLTGRYLFSPLQNGCRIVR
jgi:hypothetical protein